MKQNKTQTHTHTQREHDTMRALGVAVGCVVRTWAWLQHRASFTPHSRPGASPSLLKAVRPRPGNGGGGGSTHHPNPAAQIGEKASMSQHPTLPPLVPGEPTPPQSSLWAAVALTYLCCAVARNGSTMMQDSAYGAACGFLCKGANMAPPVIPAGCFCILGFKISVGPTEPMKPC
ncbi:putative E3 ubiquitin-protein ligase RNF144A [Platysternon megacephalum]|uniref:Putative E3 ubiquitin-protein ligase RNF144A n=1 Tax=Platysternon megacephalum TaxID=55544 RepID=A0A4D9ETW2_9SAUR|nr:putative E3 ubiquitin-protein ligase RNF144A [Platysternon megacephalum]